MSLLLPEVLLLILVHTIGMSLVVLINVTTTIRAMGMESLL
jgi:hypothetical protein